MVKILDLALYSVSVVAISTSGALSPGPLTVANMALGVKGGWKSGLQVALGHMIVELPYVFLLALFYDTISSWLSQGYVKIGFTLFVVGFMGFFAYLLIRDALSTKGFNDNSGNTGLVHTNPIVVGAVLTGLNAYFLLWWASVGLPLIEGALTIGFPLGVLYMYVLHVWLDYTWLGATAYAAHHGSRILGPRGTRILLLTLAGILLFFAATLLLKLL